jgi:hypothetical protein
MSGGRGGGGGGGGGAGSKLSALVLNGGRGGAQQQQGTTSGVPRSLPDSRPNVDIRNIVRMRHTPVPTIPIRSQSHGYETLAHGKLQPQSAPVEEYTGLGKDTVGPAMYDTSGAPVDSRAPSVNFGRASKRKPTFGMPSDGPGPFGYNTAGARFLDRSSRGTAAFESRVPMAHERGPNSVMETPAPGEYNVGSSLAAGATAAESQYLTAARAEALANKVERFGSTENRSGGWDRNIFAPFTNKKADGPGPGTVSLLVVVSVVVVVCCCCCRCCYRRLCRVSNRSPFISRVLYSFHFKCVLNSTAKSAPASSLKFRKSSPTRLSVLAAPIPGHA